MAMIACPECGTRISETASTCPYCGFKLSKKEIAKIGNRKLSERKKYTVPFFVNDDNFEIPLTREQYRTIDSIYDSISDAKTLSQIAPSLFKTIKAMFPDTKLIADITPKLKKMLESGELAISRDKDDKLLASVIETTGKNKGKIKEQIRLIEMDFRPDLMNAIINLQTQIALAKVMNTIEEIQNTLNTITVDIQDNRIAMAESVAEQLNQATYIQDSRIRDTKLLEIAGKATDARHMLAKSVYRKCKLLTNAFKSDKETPLLQGELTVVKDVWNSFMHGDNKNSDLAEDVFCSLTAITQCVKAETEVYSVLGEQNASAEVLSQFQMIIKDNHLENKEFLKLINSYSKNNDYTKWIDSFSNGCNKFLKTYSNNNIAGLLPEKNVLLLPVRTSVPSIVSIEEDS